MENDTIVWTQQGRGSVAEIDGDIAYVILDNGVEIELPTRELSSNPPPIKQPPFRQEMAERTARPKSPPLLAVALLMANNLADVLETAEQRVTTGIVDDNDPAILAVLEDPRFERLITLVKHVCIAVSITDPEVTPLFSWDGTSAYHRLRLLAALLLRPTSEIALIHRSPSLSGTPSLDSLILAAYARIGHAIS